MRRSRLAGAMLALCLVPQLASTQELSQQARARGHRMLAQLRQELERYYYDTTFHGVDVARSYARLDSAIDAAQSLPDVSGALAQFLADLNDSHTRFYPPGVNVQAAYGWSWHVVGEDCFVSHVKEGSDAEAQGLLVGDRLLAIDGISPSRRNADVISYVYYALSPRPGMRLVVEHPDGTQQEMEIQAELTRRPPVRDLKDLEMRRFAVEAWRRAQTATHRWRTIGDSVMIWQLRGFAFGSGLGGYDEAVDRLMDEARKHAVLILDLRGNGGGAVVTELRLLGHFASEPFVMGTQHTRDSTVARVVDPVGDEPYTGQVLVLIDSESASAAEITARTFQLRGWGMVLGDRSAGAVMTSIFRPLALGSAFSERRLEFGMSVTVSDVIMPDGHSLEHTGVIPNVAVLPTGRDLAEGRDPALATALEFAGVIMDPEAAAAIFP